MLNSHLIRMSALAAALCLPVGAAQAQDLSKYPNWEGKWSRDPGPPQFQTALRAAM